MMFLLFTTLTANASLIGTQVSCDIEPSIIWDCDSSITTVKGDAAEFNLLLVGNAYLEVDFDTDSILIRNLKSHLGLGANEVLSFNLQPNVFNASDYSVFSTVIGFDARDIDFDGEQLALDINRTTWFADDYILLSFMTHATAVSTAPPILLILIGLFALRKRKLKHSSGN